MLPETYDYLDHQHPACGSGEIVVRPHYCVVQLANTDSGAVFLTMNDAPENFKDHDLELHVLIEEAPLK